MEDGSHQATRSHLRQSGRDRDGYPAIDQIGAVEDCQLVDTGGPITLPTRAEILRIKGALILKRNASRDYIDFIALADRLGTKRTAAAILGLDDLYPQPNGESALRQLIVQVAQPKPFDREQTDIATYKGIVERYDSWEKLEELGGLIANSMFDAVVGRERGSVIDSMHGCEHD